MSSEINLQRRHFFGLAAMTMAAVEFGLSSAAAAKAAAPAVKAGSHASFAALKQIKAGELNVGYAEVGPANGSVVLLLHVHSNQFGRSQRRCRPARPNKRHRRYPLS